MVKKQDLLIEIGTEELPPKSLKNIAISFSEQMCLALKEEELDFNDTNWYATPRRLSLLITGLDTTQKDKKNQRRGPSLSVAFDKNKKPTKATLGFAESCGIKVEELKKLETEKGAWLVFNTILKGKNTEELIPRLIEKSLGHLPVAKRMRWGDHNVEFIRPINCTLVLFGKNALNCKILGIKSETHTYGHRFHHPIFLLSDLVLIACNGLKFSAIGRRSVRLHIKAVQLREPSAQEDEENRFCGAFR